MSGYLDPYAVWTVPGGDVKIDPHDPAFHARMPEAGDPSLPAIYLFSNSRNGDGVAYSMAEDGTVLGSHFCSHWGYMQNDLHDRTDSRIACEAHYPDGYRLVVLMGSGELPPTEVLERNKALGAAADAPAGEPE